MVPNKTFTWLLAMIVIALAACSGGGKVDNEQFAFFDDMGFRNIRSFFKYLAWKCQPGAFDGKAAVVWERGYVGDTTTDYNKVITGQNLNDSRSAEQLLSDAVSAAADASCILYIGGLNKSSGQDNEGTDR